MSVLVEGNTSTGIAKSVTKRAGASVIDAELRLSVCGSIRFAASSHKAFLVDGLMRVGASYNIEPRRIGRLQY